MHPRRHLTFEYVRDWGLDRALTVQQAHVGTVGKWSRAQRRSRHLRDGQPVLGSGASFGRAYRLLLHSLLLTYYD